MGWYTEYIEVKMDREGLDDLNSRLIKAGPELLRSLKEILETPGAKFHYKELKGIIDYIEGKK